MVKQHAQIITLLMGICDLIVVAGAWMGAFVVRFALLPAEKGIPAAQVVLTNLGEVLLASLVVLVGAGLYKPRRDKSFLLEIGQIIRASVMIWVLLIVIIYYTSAGPFTRGMLALFLPLLMAGLILERGTYRSVLRFVRRRGWNLRHALIVGTGRLGQLTFLRLQRNSWTGIRVAGFVEVGDQTFNTKTLRHQEHEVGDGERGRGGDKEARRGGEEEKGRQGDKETRRGGEGEMGEGDLGFEGSDLRGEGGERREEKAAVDGLHVDMVKSLRTVRGVAVVGESRRVREIVEEMGVDCVFVALPSEQGEALRRVVGALERTAVDVRVVPDLFLSRFPAQAMVSELDGMPVISLREDPLAGWPAVYKRVFDVVGAVFGLLLFMPVMVVVGGLIKLHDGGPVFYRQRRISYGRRAFMMVKFRTMVRDAETAGPAFAEKDDPRCTWIGKWLRSWSVDELPQLWNVVRGEMSLVGPRPERPEMLARIEAEVPGFPMRLKVRAGLTGWAQVNGFRGRTSFRKRLQYDLYYLNHWSPLLDLRIVVATVWRGLRHPNAY